MELITIVLVLASSLVTVPIVYVLDKLAFLKHQQSFFIGIVVCVSLAAAAVLPALVLRRRYRHVDWAIYVFGFFCWSSMIDLITALQLHGIFITDFNLLELRPMLNNTHGIFAAYWDGSAHYILQLSAIILFCLQENYREIGLYWCGSFINFMLLLLEGAILGNTEKGWLCFLNVPFLLLAVCVAIKFIRERPFQTRSYRKISSIVYRPLDLFFAICFLLAIGVAFLRGFAVLGANVSCMDFYLKEFEPYLTDPSAFPKVQMLVNMYYFVFYYVCAINGLVNPGQLWMSDWAIIHAGATIQSQFVHMASSFHSYTPEELHATKTGMAGAVFWGVNLAPLVIAHLFALRCWSDPDNYGCTSSTTSRYSVLNRKQD